MLLIFILCCSCFYCSSPQSVKNDAVFDTTKPTPIREIPSKEVEPATVTAQLLFSVPVKEFFKGNQKVLGHFENKDQYDLGLYVPLSFYANDQSVFIPNRAAKSIMEFDKKGTLINNHKILGDTVVPDYFSLFSTKEFAISTWDKRLFEFTPAQILNTFVNQDLFFSTSKNNILFRNKNRFYDKSGYFKGEYEFTYAYSSFDYKLLNDEEILLAYKDSESGNLNLEIIQAHGLLKEKIDFGDRLNVKKNLGLKLLSREDSKVKLILSTDEPQEGFVLLNVDLKRKEIDNKVLLLNSRIKDELFIGEGASLWPNGVVLYYSQEKNILYSLYTTPEAIEVVYYDLSF